MKSTILEKLKIMRQAGNWYKESMEIIRLILRNRYGQNEKKIAIPDEDDPKHPRNDDKQIFWWGGQYQPELFTPVKTWIQF